ncbi:MAG: SDR family oxidoreductase [bacterium]
MEKLDHFDNKKTALITGASSGIGCELSRLFAQEGYNLVLVARDEQRLNQRANELRKTFGVLIKVLPKDLSTLTSAKEIFDELQQESIQIDILVNNAGFNVYGPFSETDIKKELQMIQVSIVSSTQLIKLFLPEMLKHGYGRILNIGSTGSFVPGPLNAVYCAAKSYILSLSEALAEELEGSGVTVTTLCPGPTRTEFPKRAQIEGINLFRGPVMEVSTVAKTGYRALMRGKRVVVCGFYNKAQIFLTRFTPRKVVAKIVKYQMSK